MDPFYIILIIVILGLVFDYTNGFHDSANVVSTVIATGALKPVTAIAIAACLNTIGATQISRVAETITTGLIDPQASSQLLILAAIIGAIVWNVFTAQIGIPSSSSYALVGGLVGVALIHTGAHTVIWNGVLYKVVIPMVISPFIGFTIAFCLMKILYKYVHAKNHEHAFFRHLQIASSSLVALAHGFTDAQKSMAVITLGLFASKAIATPHIPFWVILACAITMGLGTAWGGYRVIHTVGFKITNIEPMQGFAAETSASIVILSAGFLGMPISSTHMIVGSITGVGTAKKFKAVQWMLANKMIIAWVLTMPAAGLVASLAYRLLKPLLSSIS